MIRLLITSGRGPAECRMAVAHVLRAMAADAMDAAIDIDVAGDRREPGGEQSRDLASAIVIINGEHASAFAARWRGSILWVCQSPLRPHHKRKNWFIGVVDLPVRQDKPRALAAADLTFEAFRAGGPGGQHQNKTESAVRVSHIPSGLSVVARDGRSQHRNKAIAIERLAALMRAQDDLIRDGDKGAVQAAHDLLQRGQPVRRFKGEKFEPG
jgi:peptide chain release factor